MNASQAGVLCAALALSLLAACTAPVKPGPPAPHEPVAVSKPAPRVALVMGGGAARGLASGRLVVD